MPDAVKLYDHGFPPEPIGTDGNPMVVAFSMGDQPDIDLGNVDVESIIPGIGPTNLGKAEDAVHASGDVGVMALGVRKDTAAAVAADGDYIPVIVDSTGRLWVHVGALDSVPADPFGLNADAVIAAGAAGSISAKLRAISRDLIANIVLAAGTNRIGTVGSDDKLIEVTPTLDTSAYAVDDVLFAATQVANVPVSSGRIVVLESIVVVDKDDMGVAFDIFFFDRTVTFGTINAAPSINDTDAAFCMGFVSIGSGDYKDLGVNRIACVRGIGLEMKPNTTDLYICAVTRGTPTHTASGLIIKLGFLDS